MALIHEIIRLLFARIHKKEHANSHQKLPLSFMLPTCEHICVCVCVCAHVCWWLCRCSATYCTCAPVRGCRWRLSFAERASERERETVLNETAYVGVVSLKLITSASVAACIPVWENVADLCLKRRNATKHMSCNRVAITGNADSNSYSLHQKLVYVVHQFEWVVMGGATTKK